MAIVVEHDKRKHEILEKSLDLFCKEGYEDVTFQKIADACGITRTTLYIYFKNKREIFLWSIKQLTAGLEEKLIETLKDEKLSSAECLRAILSQCVDACENNYQLFNVLLAYLLQLEKSGIDPGDRVRRRVLRLQHVLSTVLIRGQHSGEFKKVPVKDVNEMLYSLIESAIFRLSVLSQKNIEDVRGSLNLAVDGLMVNPPAAK